MTLVLDTNVVVSALLWRGTPFRLLQAIADAGVEVVTSPDLLEELREVLAREKLRPRLVRLSTSVEQCLANYRALAIIVTPSTTPRAVPDDIDDDQVVAAAVAGKADLIVSGDGDLLRLGQVNGIAVVSAAEALRLISAHEMEGTTMPCLVLLEFVAKPGTGPQMLQALRDALPETRNKDGCLSVEVTRNQDDGDNIVLVMRWASRKHYETYRAWREANGVVQSFAEATVGGLSTRFFDTTDV